MTTTGLTVKLLGDASSLNSAALEAVARFDEIVAAAARIPDAIAETQKAFVATAKRVFEVASGFGEVVENVETSTVAVEELRETTDGVTTTATALEKAIRGFSKIVDASTAKIRGVADAFQEARVAVAEFGSTAAGAVQGLSNNLVAATGYAADMGIITRATAGLITAALGSAVALATTALGHLGAVAFKMFREKISFEAALSATMVNQLAYRFNMLTAKLSLFVGVPLMIMLAKTVEEARRNVAGLTNETTPLQDALRKLAEAWERWAESMGSGMLKIAEAGINAVSSALIAMRDVVEGFESIPFLGGMIEGCEKFAATLIPLIGALAAANTASMFWTQSDPVGWVKRRIKDVENMTAALKSFSSVQKAQNTVAAVATATTNAATVATTANATATTAATAATATNANATDAATAANSRFTLTLLKGVAAKIASTTATVAATAAQIAWNVAKVFALALAGPVGIALLAAATVAAYGYARSAANAAETTEAFTGAMARLGEKAEISASKYAELRKQIEDSNRAAQSPTEAYDAEIGAIQERAEAQGKAERTITALRKKEAELIDAIAGKNGRLTREQRAEAQNRLNELRKEREELEKNFDATLKYSDAAQKRDREAARQNALSSLGIADLVNQKTAAETRDEKLESLKTALDAKLIDEAKYREAVEKVVAEFEETDEEAKKVAEANKKFAKILETNAQKAAEVYAVLNEGIVFEEDRAKIEDALNDELLRATENGKYYADALKSNVPFSERLTAELDDLTDTVGLLKDGSKSTAEREAALADARAKLTESLLSETETGKFLIDAQKAQTSVADQLAAAMLEMEANAKAAGTSDETLAAAKTKLTESILQQTEAGKYLLQAEKNLIPKTERLQKAYEEIEATARATGASEDAVAEAKRLAEEDILDKGSPETKAQKDDKPGSNAAAYFGSTAALDAANNRREDKQTPLLKEIATASKKTSAALETVAQKEEPEVFNG